LWLARRSSSPDDVAAASVAARPVATYDNHVATRPRPDADPTPTTTSEFSAARRPEPQQRAGHRDGIAGRVLPTACRLSRLSTASGVNLDHVVVVLHDATAEDVPPRRHRCATAGTPTAPGAVAVLRRVADAAG